MANNVATLVERATNDMLIGPDWSINIELCDIINNEVGQVKEVLKTIRKRLGNKNPKVQLLALSVLDTLVKNCGEKVLQQIAEHDILQEMIKIVNKKPDLGVRERILILIDIWKDALGGPRGKYPQFHVAYNELKLAGIQFPPREENNVPLFTPLQTQPSPHYAPAYEDVTIQASTQSDPSNLRDEELLCQGLLLNDDLQSTLFYHDDIAKGVALVSSESKGTHAAAVVDLHQDKEDEEESEDEFAQLARRSRDSQTTYRAGAVNLSPLPPPPSSKTPVVARGGSYDFLSGDVYGAGPSSIFAEQEPFYVRSPPRNSHPTSSYSPSFSPSPPHHFKNRNSSTTTPLFDKSPLHDEPMETSKSERIPLGPWDFPTPTGNLNTLPSIGNQGRQHFDQQCFPGGLSNSTSGSISPHNGLLGQTQNLSLNPSVPPKPENSDDALFKDLLDFASSKSSTNNKSF